MKKQRETIHLSQYDLHAEDWENALHQLFWAKGQPDLFAKIEAKAMANMKRRISATLRKTGSSKRE